MNPGVPILSLFIIKTTRWHRAVWTQSVRYTGKEEADNIPFLVQFLYFVVIDLYVLCMISSLRDARRWKFVKTVRIRDNSKKETLVICMAGFYKSYSITFQRGSHEKNYIFHYPGIITF